MLGGNQGDAVSIRPYRRANCSAIIAVASGGAVLSECLPTLVTELERADWHLQAGTIFGVAIGALILAGGAYVLWKRVKAARRLSEDAAQRAGSSRCRHSSAKHHPPARPSWQTAERL